ncbi:MAG: sulfur carrier protein ThiS [Deltaproteobacteria bacterium]|nr:sulfur carrier protein ThiS [Deltaproteobacteria bacterium]
MDITLNGEPHSLPAGTTVAQLLRRLDTPEFGAAVERNRAVVRKKDHATTLLAAGDMVEIVQFVGGG